MPGPDRFRVISRVLDRQGAIYEACLSPVIDFPSIALAEAHGQQQLALSAGFRSDGTTDDGRFWQCKTLAFRIHAYHEPPPGAWGLPPMHGEPGPDEDTDEITDIPRAYRVHR